MEDKTGDHVRTRLLQLARASNGRGSPVVLSVFSGAPSVAYKVSFSQSTFQAEVSHLLNEISVYSKYLTEFACPLKFFGGWEIVGVDQDTYLALIVSYGGDALKDYDDLDEGARWVFLTASCAPRIPF